MANPAPIISQINAFNATEGTIISFNIVGGTSIVRSNIIYIYDLSDNSLICTHLYISTESIHELPANTDPSIAYASGKSSADFTNGKQYYAQIQTFTNTAGTEGASGASIAKLFWCLVDPTLTINTIPSSISTTSYNVGAVYNSNTTATSNIVQQYQFNLYSATGVLVQSSGVITGSGAQQGTSTAYDLSYNFTGLNVGSSYYVTVEATTTEGMTVSAQSNTFTVSIDTPTLGEATVVNNACDGYISVTSNLSGEYGGSASGEIASFVTSSVNDVSSLKVTLTPIQDLHGYDSPWVGGAGANLVDTDNPLTFTTTKKITFAKPIPSGTKVYTYAKSHTYETEPQTGAKEIAMRFEDANSQPVGIGYATNTGTYSITLTGDAVSVLLYSNGYNYTESSGVKVTVIDLMVSESKITSYQPYSNICPISGRTEVDAYVTGKNLLNPSTKTEFSANTWRWHYSDGYVLKRNVAYNFSWGNKENNPFNIYLYIADFETGTNYNAGNNSISFTPTEDINVKFQAYYSGGIPADAVFQLELGSTATDYEPYNGQSYTADLPQTVYGGSLDVVTGELVVDKAMVDLGTLAWSKVATSGNNYWFRASKPDIAITPRGSVMPNIVCSHYGTLIPNNAYIGNTGVSQIAQASYVVVCDMTYSDEATFKSAMNGVQLCYELATPQTIQCDPQTVQTMIGQNNIWSDGGDVEITYNIPITNLLVKRQDVADVSGAWLTLYSQPITQASDMDFTFIDFLNQHGKTYRYALVPLLTQEQSGVEVEVEGGYTVSDEVVSIFDGVFVADNTAIYKLKAGVNYGDLSKVQEVGSINTIGSQYPIIVSNSKVDYRTASLSATIVADDYYNNGNLNRMDMVQKRELMESFFTNKRAKILKDWNGNIWLVVFTDNINISFINEYGMGIATLTAAWTEIGDVTNEEDLQNTRIINVG